MTVLCTIESLSLYDRVVHVCTIESGSLYGRAVLDRATRPCCVVFALSDGAVLGRATFSVYHRLCGHMRLDSQHAGPDVRGVVSRAPTTAVTFSLRKDQLSAARLTERLWQTVARHAEQADPTEPTDPAEKADPAEPTDLAKQADPAEKADPAEPTDLAKQADLAEPTDRAASDMA